MAVYLEGKDMKVEYIAQPDVQLGRILSELLDSEPKRAVLVSAFVGLQTIMRIKAQVSELKNRGAEIRFVVGIDLGGTSQEVLQELVQWNISVCIVKHRIPGHTFHPKLYLFEWDHKAEIIIGSNNITEGGFFGNYEGCARITYDIPDDSNEFVAARKDLKRFINPTGPIAKELTAAFLNDLIASGEVPTEAEARKGRDVNRESRARKIKANGKAAPLFGTEEIDPPPPLPADLLERLVEEVRRRRKARKKTMPTAAKKTATIAQPPIDAKAGDELLPAAFYMTLPTLQGENIPGEGRVPLEAIELAKEFWGWPDEYKKDVSPRTGRDRVYWNWRPTWRVSSVQSPKSVTVQQVRMYMYENSSDFRFYVRPLVNAGGDLGDVVRIRRIAEPNAEYECVLARQGTPEYEEWIRYCTQAVRNSTRRFGYA
jgi:HKD family nuclease